MFKRAVLLAVLLLALGFGTAFAAQIDGMTSGNPPASPVFVNPGGLGDALIYGYYNVRDNRMNVFTVVNTNTSFGVRARIRFLEASDAADSTGNNVCNGSHEILDFDICLSPGDVWSGRIQDVGGVATLFSDDDDTFVDIAQSGRGLRSVIFADEFPAGKEFAFGSNVQNLTADQTREGYFIVIGENNLTEVVSGGNCGPGLLDTTISVDNVLGGLNYMVDLDTLASFAYNAAALGDFSDGVFLTNPADALPNLTSGTDGVAGLNFALTKSKLVSIYDLEADIAGKTELIVNFPTKLVTPHTCTPTTDDIFDDPRVLITVFDDEENSPLVTCEFSPCPPGTDVKLPFEVNVIDLNNSNIFTSTVEVAISTTFEFGWLSVDLVNAATSAPVPAHRTIFRGQMALGLPAIGYTAIDVASGDSTHLLPLQYTASVVPAAAP